MVEVYGTANTEKLHIKLFKYYVLSLRWTLYFLQQRMTAVIWLLLGNVWNTRDKTCQYVRRVNDYCVTCHNCATVQLFWSVKPEVEKPLKYLRYCNIRMFLLLCYRHGVEKNRQFVRNVLSWFQCYSILLYSVLDEWNSWNLLFTVISLLMLPELLGEIDLMCELV